MEKRYKQGNYDLSYYLVECPQCDKYAEVRKIPDTGDIICLCNNCMLHKSLNDLIQYKIYVKRNCPYCGEPFYKEQSGLKTVPDDMQVKCPRCDVSMEFKPNVTAYIPDSLNTKLKCDPHFGFPLWLQSHVRSDLFWAYNKEHLLEIRNYVASSLRERHLMTMVARLPQFIKEAKNREEVLKVIDRLMKK